MKTKILSSLVIILLFTSSCKKFLEEENLSGGTPITDAFKTEGGCEGEVAATYVTLRTIYGKENGWDLTESGTDLYTWGSDNRSRGFCTYQTFLAAEEQARVAALWAELYRAINTCNLILEKIDGVPYVLPEVRKYRKGEVSYLRAFYNWFIVEQWGGVALSTSSTVAPTHDVKRSSVDDFYKQIFTDMDTAINNLPLTTTEYGRITIPVAEAFLARLYLTRGMNQQASDMAKRVISSYSYKLLSKWSDIWDLDKIKNDEIIWAVNYSDNAITTRTNLRYLDPKESTNPDINKRFPEYNTFELVQRDGGNHGMLDWEIRYEQISTSPVMTRDVQNGRGFQRWMPTKFFIDLFNEKIDQRFYGSFKNVWYANLEDSTLYPKWPGLRTNTGKIIKNGIMKVGGKRTAVDTALVGRPMFHTGDTAVFFSKEPVPDSIKGEIAGLEWKIHPKKGYFIIDINDMYNADGTSTSQMQRQFYFPITKKYADTTLVDMAVHPYSRRDAPVFRVSEMYLIASEALMKTGQRAEALQYINTLRQTRAFPGKEAQMTITDADLTLDFILDERARELATENLRWLDLKRTGKLVERVKAHNTDAAPYVKEYHNLRFIPQNQLDAIYNKTDFPQNPGY